MTHIHRWGNSDALKWSLGPSLSLTNIQTAWLSSSSNIASSFLLLHQTSSLHPLLLTALYLINTELSLSLFFFFMTLSTTYSFPFTYMYWLSFFFLMWTIFKVFIEFVTILLLACGTLAPQPGIEPVPPALEGKVLTLGPAGKFLYWLSFAA